MVAIQVTESTQTQARHKATDCASADEFTHCSAKFLASVRKSRATDHAYTEKEILQLFRMNTIMQVLGKSITSSNE